MEENLSGGLKGYSSRTCTQEGKAIKRYLFWIYLLKMKKKKKKKNQLSSGSVTKKMIFLFILQQCTTWEATFYPKCFNLHMDLRS